MTVVTADLPPEDFPTDPPGTGVYYQTPRGEIPDVAGLTFEDAEEAMFKAGFKVEAKRENSLLPEDTVIGSSPDAGERKEQGSTVEVLVSNGLSPSTALPDLIGRTEADVNQILLTLQQNSEIGFTWEFGQAPTLDPAQNGLVIASSPGPGSGIDETSVVTLTLGLYVAPVVP